MLNLIAAEARESFSSLKNDAMKFKNDNFLNAAMAASAMCT